MAHPTPENHDFDKLESILHVYEIPLILSPTPGDHDLNGLESSPPEDVSKQVITFLVYCFFEKIFKKLPTNF